MITTKVGLELKVIGLKSSVERGISCCVHLYLAGFGTQRGFSARGGGVRFQREINPFCHCLLWPLKSLLHSFVVIFAEAAYCFVLGLHIEFSCNKKGV